MVSVIRLSVSNKPVVLSVIMLNVVYAERHKKPFILSVIIWSIIILNVIMLSVENKIFRQCHYAACCN